MSNKGLLPNANHELPLRPTRRVFLSSGVFIVPAGHDPRLPIEVTLAGGSSGYFVCPCTFNAIPTSIKDRLYGLLPGQRIQVTIGARSVSSVGGTSSFGTYLTAPANLTSGTTTPTGGGPEAIVCSVNATQVPPTPLVNQYGGWTDSMTSGKGICIVDYWSAAPWSQRLSAAETFASQSQGI